MSNGKEFGVMLAPTFVPTTNILSVSPGAVLAGAGQAAAAAAPVVLGVAAAAGAVFLTRAALRGLSTLDTRDRMEAAGVAANRAESLAWDRAFTEVMTRTARITRLRQIASGLVGQPESLAALPTPFTYGGESRDAVSRWCQEMDRTLADAERHVTDLQIRSALAHPAVSKAESAVRRRIQRSLLGGYSDAERAVLVPRPSTGPPPGGRDHPPVPGDLPVPDDFPVDDLPAPDGLPGTGGRGGPNHGPVGGRRDAIQPLVDHVLDKLAATVSPEDMVRLAEQAERVVRSSARDTKAELDELYLLAHEARLRQQRRVADALQAARLLVGLAPLENQPDRPVELSAYQRQVLDALREVAAERRPLDSDLRADAEDLAALARRAAEDRVISEIFAQELSGLGYEVHMEHRGAHLPVRLSVSRPNWTEGHAAEIETSHGNVVARFRTAVPVAGAGGRPDLTLRDWARDVRRAKQAAALRHVCSGDIVVEGEPPDIDQLDDEWGLPERAQDPLEDKLRERTPE